MTTYIQYELADKTVVLLEATDQTDTGQAGGVTKAARMGSGGGHLITPSNQKLEVAVSSVRGPIDMLLANLKQLQQIPTEIEIKFGLTTTGQEGHLAFCKVGTEANYVVTLKWEKPD
jgi:hypothetical protein